MRQPNELAKLLVLVRRHSGKARIGENQTRHLPHTKDLLCREEAILIKYPPSAARLAVKCAVAGVVNHVELLVHDQQGELERVARLGTHDPIASLAEATKDGRQFVGILAGSDPNGHSEIVFAVPRFPRLVEHLNDCQALLSGVRKGESPGAGSAMSKTL